MFRQPVPTLAVALKCAKGCFQSQHLPRSVEIARYARCCDSVVIDECGMWPAAKRVAGVATGVLKVSNGFRHDRTQVFFVANEFPWSAGTQGATEGSARILVPIVEAGVLATVGASCRWSRRHVLGDSRFRSFACGDAKVGELKDVARSAVDSDEDSVDPTVDGCVNCRLRSFPACDRSGS